MAGFAACTSLSGLRAFSTLPLAAGRHAGRQYTSTKGIRDMFKTTTARTELLGTGGETYAYRRLGSGNAPPLICLQHFTGTLDNWDPAVIDPLALRREVLLFDNAGIGRSSGEVPDTMAGMAKHVLAFLDGLGLELCDVLGFSLGGAIAQVMAQERPSIVRKMILAATAPRGGEDVMHLEKPELAKHLADPELRGYMVLKKLFFTPSPASQAAGEAYVGRIKQRRDDLDPPSKPEVAQAQMAAFREWDRPTGERFADLRGIRQPTLVVNGTFDTMIAVSNSYRLAENLHNAMLLTYPDAGHGSLFQYPESFTRHADAFLSSDSHLAAH
jgi:pimeloyl-ACP methyl ester carboxylesterase